MLGGERLQRSAHRPVRRDPARDDQRRRFDTRDSPARPVDQAIDHRGLEGCGDILWRMMPHRPRHRALEAGEREMRLGRSLQRSRQRHDRLPQRRRLLDVRPAGKAQAQQLRGLVERLARGIVDRRRDPAIAADALDQQQLAMPARHQQQQIGKGEVRIGQPRAERMPLQMIDRDERLARRMRQRLAGDEPHHHAADQPRPCRRRDRIDLIQSQPGILERRRDQRLQRLDVRARRDFGHHAPEGRMRRLLPCQPVAEHLPIAGDERGGGFVARGFEAEDDPGGHGRPSIAPHGGCRRVGVWAWLQKRGTTLTLPRLRRSLPLPPGEGRGPPGAAGWEG